MGLDISSSTIGICLLSYDDKKIIFELSFNNFGFKMCEIFQDKIITTGLIISDNILSFRN